jgi:UDP-N-acetylglucosamine 1-carboxyvinyltransferase
MSSFKISGGTPLFGSVRLGGAKNASFKLMIASLLSDQESRLLNFSRISDVAAVGEMISSLGGKVEQRGERTLFINPASMQRFAIDEKFGPQSRSAPMFVPVLLHRFGEAKVPNPGGDKIGKRPMERQWGALRRMGASIEQEGEFIVARAKELKGIDYTFEKNSHTGTETVLMAAVLAKGKTILRNAALEPEVDDLIVFLNNMGARIRRRYHRIIEIDGVDKVSGTIHRIMSDRNEAVSYACAAIATKGDIIVENAKREYLEAFLEKLDEMGGGYEIGPYGIRFFYKGPLISADIVTSPHPGFMTDWQPLWAVLATQAEGESIIHETIFPSRFQYIEQLQAMGVDAQLFNPELDNPDKVYNFDLDSDEADNFHAAKIRGIARLKSGEFHVKDLRHGATLVIAAIIAGGSTILHNVEQIDRGYEELDVRLRSMGANIERID